MPRAIHIALSLFILSPLFGSQALTFHYDDTSVARQERIYDESNRCIELNDATGHYQFAYNEQGLLLQILYPNGVETLFTYNPSGTATDVHHKLATGSCFLSFHYEYDRSRKSSTQIK